MELTATRAGGTGTWALLDRPVQMDAARAVAHRHQGLAEHLHALGHRPVDPLGLLAALEAAGLTGRGGAHHPVAAKWRATLARGGATVVVANGAESEPACAKDAALLSLRPHLVLDGLTLAARTLGAGTAVVWVHRGSSALASLSAALRERGTAGLDDPPVRVVETPATYLSGESTAIRRALTGGPALPAGHRVGGSILVQNVETLARVALVARGHGDTAERALVTLDEARGRSVLEVGPGDTVAGLLDPRAPHPAAVLLGGWAGTWLPWPEAAAAHLAGPGRHPATGAGLVAPLPPGVCGLDVTARLLRYLAGQGAGQCGPCVFGLPALATAAERIARGSARRRELARLTALAAEVDGRGACGHPDGAVRLLISALETFADDAEAHTRRGRCLMTEFS